MLFEDVEVNHDNVEGIRESRRFNVETDVFLFEMPMVSTNQSNNNQLDSISIDLPPLSPNFMSWCESTDYSDLYCIERLSLCSEKEFNALHGMNGELNCI